MRAPGAPDVLELITEPDVAPGPGEIAIRARACAVGWPDILVRRGHYPWMPPLPATLGFELSGHVEAIGANVVGLTIGQSVYLSSYDLGYSLGCYTDYAVVPASTVLAVPADVDLEQAANLGYVALAWALLNEGGARSPRGSILITGAASGTGSCLVQLAKKEGAFVIGSVGSAEKIDFVKQLGADHVINYRSSDLAANVLEVTGGAGVDLVLNHVAGATIVDSIKMLRPWGTVIMYGAIGGPAEGELVQAQRAGFGKCAGLRFFSMHGYEEDPDGRSRILRSALELLVRRSVRMPIAKRFPFTAASEAHQLLESGATCGRIVLVA